MAKKTVDDSLKAEAILYDFSRIWQKVEAHPLPLHVDRKLFFLCLRLMAADIGLADPLRVGLSDEEECRVTGLIAIDVGGAVAALTHVATDLPEPSEWAAYVLPPAMQGTYVLDYAVTKIEAVIRVLQSLELEAYVEFGSWLCLSEPT